ncbi:MAG: hypothetical protein CTY31_11415 [Hyphomicrobium sp.]|nr:MAG: hypothetical protein CTY39_00840 [Hyphomicrobium sp.]PPC99016.1 MAG: hypothetical protein CTY31_11415 [Hyphomicrobium sp.]
MATRIGTAVSVAIISLSLAGNGDIAFAADAYVCGPDKLVYVEIKDLERMKRSDACIAAYYGLKIEPERAEVKTKAIIENEPKLKEPLKTNSSPIKFKPIVQDDIVKDGRRADLNPAQLTQSPLPSANTDYRNVRIINAVSEDQTWYRHQQ